MKQRALGRSGVSVSAIGLGTMMFGPGGNVDEDECIRMTHRALDAGVNLIDTADGYGRGESERIVGRALAGAVRDDVVLATKCYFPHSREVNQRGGSRRWILRACDESLRRLRTDRIDLYQLHRLDPNVDIEESLAALTELMRAGKVLAVGTSGASAHDIVHAQWVATRARLRRPVSEQPPYSLFVRGIERAVLPACERHGVGVLVYGPLNGGWLTGKYHADAAPPADSRAARGFYSRRWWNQDRAEVRRKLQLLEQVHDVAGSAGLTLAHLALGFALAHRAVSSVLIGPRTLAQLDGLLSGVDVELSPAALDQLDAIVPPGVDVDPSDVVRVDRSLELSERRR